jgi:hypothetical protein
MRLRNQFLDLGYLADREHLVSDLIRGEVLLSLVLVSNMASVNNE